MDRRHVERERLRAPDVGLREPAEDDPEHGVGVGHGADGGAGVGAHALLVHDDGDGQAVERVDVGAGGGAHEALEERRVGLVDEAPGLGRDGLEDEGRLARSRHAREYGEAPLGDVEADVPEVVGMGATDLDGAPGGVLVDTAHGGTLRHRAWRRDDDRPGRGGGWMNAEPREDADAAGVVADGRDTSDTVGGCTPGDTAVDADGGTRPAGPGACLPKSDTVAGWPACASCGLPQAPGKDFCGFCGRRWVTAS